METNRRSSKRQQKIPNHFHDSIHDLNKKKDTLKNKGTNVKDKKVVDCLDQADRECLVEDVNQGSMFDDMVDSQKNASRNLMDSEIREGELKACSDKGCDKDKEVDENADKGRNNNVDNMKFGSVNEDMLTRNKGSNNLKLPTSMHVLNDPSFFLTNKTGSPQGKELGLMSPLSESSRNCSDNSFISDGANQYGARATGAALGIKSI
ncbi:hypothetical protein Tco_0242526 [Tanacetum coccineum]